MTLRGLYESVLIKLRKENAPAIHLEEFNEAYRAVVNKFGESVGLSSGTTQNSKDAERFFRESATYTVFDFQGRLPGSNVLPYPLRYRHLRELRTTFELLRDVPEFCWKRGEKKAFNSKPMDVGQIGFIEDDPFISAMFTEPKYLIENNGILLWYGTDRRVRLDQVDIFYVQHLPAITLLYVHLTGPDESPSMPFDEMTNEDIADRMTQYFMERQLDPRVQSFGPVHTKQPRPEDITVVRN